MDFSILGPTAVTRDGVAVGLGGPRRRALLALLVVRRLAPVRPDRLIDELWDGAPTRGAAATLQSHIAALRRAVGPERILTAAGGYQLVASDDEVDTCRFERAVASGRALLGTGDAHGAVRRLDEGLSLWRGSALADAGGAAWATGEAARFDELRLAALEAILEGRLALGQTDRVVADAEAAIAEHPLRERLWHVLMLGLYRAGRQADALNAYGRLRRRLDAELGIQPSSELAGLEVAILKQDPGLASPAPPRPSAVPVTAPAAAAPRGHLTLLFTDIEGSTRLWEADPDAMSAALRRHDAIVRDAVENAGGRVFKTVGDAFCAAFDDAVEAVRAAIATQQALASESWPVTTPIRVRIGLHSGVCEERGGDYFGTAVNRVARLESIAHGGQVLLSAATAELVRDVLPVGTSLLDLGEHRLKDLSRPERVFQATADGVADSFPPLRSLDNPALRHNLPEQVSTFVGREREVAAVRGLLERSRVVTLAGPGGVGKTRLAVHVAAELLDGSGDGVWLVELAPLQDPALIGPAVAGVLGVADQPARPLLQAVVDSVRDRELLLILDNCEHVIDAAAAVVAELVRRCPRLVVLATSREPLRIPGEHVHRIPSLDVPAEHDQIIERVTSSDAVRLFVERAREQNPDFRVDAENASAVASVVRRLDGIPLAIELAAARLRALSLDDLTARLDQRFRLLTGGSRTILPRQRTLEALIGWSYDLLSPSEQVAFERLSVFSGGFDLAAAEAVCPPDITGDALDVVVALVDKSLIQADDRRGQTRYGLLETVREYAAARLADRGTSVVDDVRRLHRDHYLSLAEHAEPRIRGPEQVAWLARLEAEHDNLRMALSTCMDDGDSEAALRLATAVSAFRSARGHASESLAALDAALTMPSSGEPEIVRARALAAWARISHDYGAAIDRTTRALAIARALGDQALVAAALRGLSDLAHRQGRLEDAVLLADQGLEVARPLGDDHSIGMLLRSRGIALLNLGRDPSSDTMEALECFRRAGNRIQVATTLGNVGVNELDAGNLEAARRHLEESLRLARELDNPRQVIVMTINLGLLAHLEGDDESARRLLLDALDAGRGLRDWECMLYALGDIALTETSSGDPARAARIHGAVDGLGERLGEQMEALEARLRDADHARLRDRLGPERFDALVLEGGRRPLDDVVDELLGRAVTPGGCPPSPAARVEARPQS